MKETTVIILAAGNSERMGTAKQQLHFKPNLTFLDHLINQYRMAGLKKIMVVAKCKELTIDHQQSSFVECIQNSHPDKGRAWSIYLGLQLAGNSDQVFIQNIDNPFTDHYLIEEMMRHQSPEHVIYPSYQNKKAHPVLIPLKLKQQILNNEFALFDFKKSLGLFPSKLIPWNDDKILANINRPEDYQHWFDRKP